MEYERIEKPLHQGGGFSPKKLRAMLLGVEKRRKEDEEEIESKFTLKSEAGDRGGSIGEEFKDVDMVSSVSDPSSSSEPEPITSGHRPRDPINSSSRVLKPQEDDSFDSESVASNFEFHKDIRSPNPNRSPIVPSFSKPTPSKWADAQKWIASPNLSRIGRTSKKPERVGMKNPVTKVVLEATIEEVADTKRVDSTSQEKREIIGLNNRPTNWAPDPYPELECYPKPAPVVLADSAVSLSRHDPSVSLHSATAFIPPSTVRSVSMRDMGTEMTPIASQEPSRTGTPVRPASPNPSTSTSPRRSLTGTDPNPNPNLNTKQDFNTEGLSEKEIQMKTRREIMVLGTQLGKTSIAAWASKQEEEKAASRSLQSLQTGSACQSVIETRAAAWEEAEKAKFIARFKREEIKIHAWENHQKAKIEAEMRKVEVEVEKMRAHAQDLLMNKLADTRHKAEEKRAMAEAKRTHAAARTAEQAEYIRRTGRVPSTFFSCSCWGWCA
ncbi:remorin family protein isoform X1 [Carex rostrata]